MAHVGDEYLQVLLSESLAKAYTLATMERNPAAAVAFLAVRGQVERACLVESFWQKLCGTLPLSCAIANILKSNGELVSFLELILAKFYIFSSNIKEACVG